MHLSSQVITVNHKKYAVGLFWQPMGNEHSVRNYARTLARGINQRHNLYTEYKMMIGLGARKNGQRVGMHVAATDVLEAFSEYTSFLAVFQTNKGFYLIAARNGIILEDKLFDSADEARTEYAKMSEIPDWGAFFAPAEWGMPRAAESRIEDVLNGRSRATLHLISHFRAFLWSLLLIVAFCAGLGAIFYDSISQAIKPRPKVTELNPELVAEYKRQIEEKNKELDAQFEIEKTLPPEPIVMPYENLPEPAARAQLCYQAIAFLMQPITGWNQIYAECNDTHAVVEFKRSFGTLGEFYTYAPEIIPNAYIEEINEDTLRARAKLPVLDTFSSQDERDAETIVRDITSDFQSIDTNVDTMVIVDTLTNGVDTATTNVVEVGAESKLMPMEFMQIFDNFGGVYMMKCTWDVVSRSWNYEVIIYAK